MRHSLNPLVVLLVALLVMKLFLYLDVVLNACNNLVVLVAFTHYRSQISQNQTLPTVILPLVFFKLLNRNPRFYGNQSSVVWLHSLKSSEILLIVEEILEVDFRKIWLFDW